MLSGTTGLGPRPLVDAIFLTVLALIFLEKMNLESLLYWRPETLNSPPPPPPPLRPRLPLPPLPLPSVQPPKLPRTAQESRRAVLQLPSPVNSITARHLLGGGWCGVGGGAGGRQQQENKPESIVSASPLSQNGRSRSGLKRSRNRSRRLCPTTKWPRRSGSTRPTGAAPTAAPPAPSGPPSTSAWSSARSAPVSPTV